MDEETVNIYEAKTGFSRLVRRVEQGERVTISRDGRPVARLVPIEPSREARRPGAWRDRVTIAADFDDFGPADGRDWYGDDA
ncbi:type II toxin-antitoxin system Phd/YefM family antitoxin [Agromyces larvae]|uniref:Antitoxin n=1 Tax=Agromyces larvae TaxID=2929802 RepID=A0ABY4BVH3_9MICO|nr:type II toxin-antitoxin system prevent-host-death family antitoxin [Agromyces larvae]UOE42894.1 type II toxin-antitoxin system prevent-host-death family antitoxin [Agromyces larvae]